MHCGFSPFNKPMHAKGSLTDKRVPGQQKKGCVGQCAAYGEQAWTQPETNLSIGALASFPDFSGRMILPATSSHDIFFCGTSSNTQQLSPTLDYPTPSPLCILWLFFLFVHLFFSVSALWLSDVFERDLVEMVLEVAVSQISQRQRDMLLRQVGVLLGVLDSDILVQEISAFHEQRWVTHLR